MKYTHKCQFSLNNFRFLQGLGFSHISYQLKVVISPISRTTNLLYWKYNLKRTTRFSSTDFFTIAPQEQEWQADEV